jgi:hypothetical protein
MEKILDHLKNVKYDINIDCFTKTNLPHIRPETLQLSVQVPMGNPFGNEEEYHGKFVSMIMNDLSQSVVKKIFQYVFENGKKSFIDLTNRFGNSQFETHSTKSRKVFSKIHFDIPHSYLVTGGRIASDYFMDLPTFMNLPFTGNVSNSSGLVYPVGSIQLQTKREVWVDPFMRWDDNYILCFDYIYVDFGGLSFNLQNDSRFSPHIVVSLDLKFEVINPVVFFIYEDNYVKYWDIQSIVKQEDRDKKIDYILDESKESRQDSQFGFHFDDKLEP